MSAMPMNYTENRATVHLHGGHVPWISDGTPHQWITPAGEDTPYPKGVSVQYVPDMWFDPMTHAPVPAGTAGATNDPGDGSLTFYYTNQQSARLMFYHDHTFGITRLNVYAGEAAGYFLTDQVEQDLIAGTNYSGVNPTKARVLPDSGLPLIIQDKTFVDATTIGEQDPTWNWGTTPPTPNTGDLWMPHVYMTAQNPYDPSGINNVGRWQYAPWWWPPVTNLIHPPVPNEFYDPNCDPTVTWCEPPYRPDTPNPSMAMEAFMDTPVVNGTAYPYLEVDPKAYRFRILNASNDRFLNLQLYVAADKHTVTPPLMPVLCNGLLSAVLGADCTEVKMVPADKTPGFPSTWPTDGRTGGVPDPATAGPSFVQIGTEGGFLPAPVVIPNQPVAWNRNQTTFNFGNVTSHTLLLGTAERADVIVDFSRYAGKTLILYNDAPAQFPANDPRYDYYTGDPDQTASGGAPSTLPGYGPNTRTIMQIRVRPGTPVPYDMAALQAVFAKTGTKIGVFEASQDTIIVPQSGYNSAYNATFSGNAFVRIQDNTMTFTPIGSAAPVTLQLEPKALQDEMGEAFDKDYGRMSGMLGLELPNTNALIQQFVLYPFASPPVEILKGTVFGTSIGSLDDGTQIWKITHNGVDTHTIHTHLFNMQLINRVTWDGIILPPDPNELGWKDTIRVNPLEDTIVALRPILPTGLPFKVPNSIRLIDPTMPEGAILPGALNGFFDPNGQPVTVTNHYVNYGWEYVVHCHLLGHEEMDMMHSMALAVAPDAPSNLTATATGTEQVVLTWTDNSLNETGFTVQRATDAGFTTGLASFPVAANVTTYADQIGNTNQTYYYRVFASNTVGDTMVYAAPSLGFPTKNAVSAFSNTVASQ